MLQLKSYISQIPTGSTDLTISNLHQIIIGLVDNHHFFLYNHIFNTVTYVVLICIYTNIKVNEDLSKKKCTRDVVYNTSIIHIKCMYLGDSVI